jgi:predicted esterase YcpF (UPF0227 family)
MLTRLRLIVDAIVAACGGALPGCGQLVIEGGDHGLTDFANYLEAVLDFCGRAR